MMTLGEGVQPRWSACHPHRAMPHPPHGLLEVEVMIFFTPSLSLHFTLFHPHLKVMYGRDNDVYTQYLLSHAGKEALNYYSKARKVKGRTQRGSEVGGAWIYRTTALLGTYSSPHPHPPPLHPPQHPWNKLVQVRQSDNMRSFFLFFFFPAVFFFPFFIELSPSISPGIVICAVRLTFRISNISLCTLYRWFPIEGFKISPRFCVTRSELCSSRFS